MLSRVFDDKRVCAAVYLAWAVVVICIFKAMGVLQSKFVGFGPSEDVRFMDMPIDTWEKWSLLALFGFVDTCMWELAHDAIVPWTLNTICDDKCRTLPYSKLTCLAIVQAYYFHGVILGAFGFFLSLTQLDLVLLRGLAHFLVRSWTHWRYMRGKAHAPPGYVESAGDGAGACAQ